MTVEGVAYTHTPSDVNKYIYLHLANLGRKIQADARRMVGKDSGELRQAISWRILKDPVSPSVEIYADLPYARMHHDGTRPHVIVPVKARVLRFNQGGRVVYAKRVYHPGTRPNRYLTVPMAAVVARD